jgi:pimeloyl-ACP methyl ester carboxylesterase
MTTVAIRSTQKSTNVRGRLAWPRRLVGALARIAPGATAAVAERLFFTPPRPHPSRGERALAGAHRADVQVDGRRIAAWRWGEGPVVVLVHGWGGRAGQLTSFVEPLTSRGFAVVAFDAPGHGRSGRGLSSAPQFARALQAVARSQAGAHAIVAHSLGAAAVALALRDGLRVERVVFLGAAADPPAWVGAFARRLGLPDGVVDRLRARSERRLGISWSELHVPRLAASFEVPLLIVHDRDDREVAPEDATEIAAAWRGARVVETAGLGHNRPLRDAGVVRGVVEFVTGGSVATCACGAPAAEAGSCEPCRLEAELFDPAGRWEALANRG